MRSTIYLLTLLSLALSMGPSIGCCKRGAMPEPHIVQVRERCLRQPPPASPDLTSCSRQGHDVKDCLAHEIEIRDAWIAAAWASCAVAP
jgi:hypothetical protein